MLKLLWKLLASGTGKRELLDAMLREHDAKLRFVPEVVEAPSNASQRNSFTSAVPEEEMALSNLSFAQRRQLMPTMIQLMWQMNRSADFYVRPVRAPRTDTPPGLLDELEVSAREAGATQVSYVRLTDDCLFSGLGVPHRNAIVYTVRMDKAALDTAPSFEAFHEVARGYLRLARIGNRITELMRAAGAAAYPGTALGGLTDYSRVAERAGLGTIGYHGCLITPEEGALLRINTIYTSLEDLPQVAPQPTSWIRDFCSLCHKCVRECPPQAIHWEPSILPNGRVECIDTTSCLDYFARNFGCAICIDVCPFTQSGYEKIEARFKGNADAPKFDLVALMNENPTPSS